MVETPLNNTIWAAAASDVGLVRSRNEDGAWLAGRFVRDGHHSAVIETTTIATGLFLAVADGVGGAAAGDQASRFVLEQMAMIVSEHPPALTSEAIAAWMLEHAESVNRRLVRRGMESDDVAGMATTLTGLYFYGRHGWWFNAGDSRVYQLHQGHLTQLSRDHTLRELLGDPEIPGNIISNCFGGRDEFYLDTGDLDHDAFDAGDRIYLLCSDGLSDYAEHAKIEAIMAGTAGAASPRALEDAALSLVELAKGGGGRDNITCMIVWPGRT